MNFKKLFGIGKPLQKERSQESLSYIIKVGPESTDQKLNQPDYTITVTDTKNNVSKCINVGSDRKVAEEAYDAALYATSHVMIRPSLSEVIEVIIKDYEFKVKQNLL